MISSRHFKLAALTALVMHLLSGGIAMAGENSSVQLRIDRIEERIGSVDSSNAILVLIFRNISKSPRDIRFYGQAHGLYSRIHLAKSKQFSVRGQSAALNAGECATVKYEWYSEAGKKLQEGIADLSGDDMRLPPDGVDRPFYLPIKAPSANGNYKLHVVFSNKNLAEVMETHSHVDQNLLYLQLSAEEYFVISARRDSWQKD